MTRTGLLTLLLLLFAARAVADDAPTRPPNIVLLFADDAGYADFGFQPAAAEDVARLTPHIDSIAEEGVRFTSAYMAGCVCSPSRAGLLTGRYPARFGHEQNIPPGYLEGGMDLKQRTVADRLRTLGYRTGIVGKWHLGYPPAYHPNRRGFDWFYGLLQGSRSYFPYERPSAHRVIQENGEPTSEDGYVTDRLGDAAVRFITESAERPFFLFVSFTAPHGPLEPKPEDLRQVEWIERGRRRRYAGVLKSLDDNVGKVLSALREQGLERDTLVVFTNDNGGQTQVGANNGVLRGRKGQLLEGGIRVPFAARWPGRIEAGGALADPVISLDLIPTFVAAAGGTTDPAWALDGVDLLPVLEGRVPTLPLRPLFWRTGGPGREIALRLGRFKLHFADRSEAAAAALYDLASDIGESKDLAATEPELVLALGALLSTWEAGLEDPRWGTGPRRRGRQGKGPGKGGRAGKRGRRPESPRR